MNKNLLNKHGLKYIYTSGGLRFVIKCGLAAAVVYQSVDQGVWGNSVKTTKLYEDISVLLEPVSKEIKDTVQLPELPTSGEVGFIATHYWNLGVKKTFVFLKDLPTNTARLGCNSYNYVVNHPEIKKLQAGGDAVKVEQ